MCKTAKLFRKLSHYTAVVTSVCLAIIIFVNATGIGLTP